MKFDPKLREYANARQLEVLDAIEKANGIKPAARLLNVHKSTIQSSLKAVKATAARKGYSPDEDMNYPVPDPFVVRGTSTLVDKRTGETVLQWIKTSTDDEKLAAMREAAYEAMAKQLPRAKPVKLAKHGDADLANLVVFTDYHLGMLAWVKEGGAEWDLKIAEKLLYDAFAYMIEAAPRAGTCILCLQGDFLHTDGRLPVTPAHKHVLDAAARYGAIIDSAITVIRLLIRLALERHDKVVLIICEGNHDETGSRWMQGLFKALYDQEPRLTVNDSEVPYYAYQHGETMLAFHHGHKLQPNELPSLFAAEFPQMWGATTRRYGHCGHQHHTYEKEHRGMTVTQHQTLAARDAHAGRGGWHADRSAQVITYHKRYGQKNRVIVCPEMFHQAAA